MSQIKIPRSFKIIVVLMMSFLVISTLTNIIIVSRQDVGISYIGHTFNQSTSNYDFLANINQTLTQVLKSVNDIKNNSVHL